MISEKELSKLSYTGAPSIITDTVPGPKCEQAWSESARYETPTHPAASRVHLIWEEALGTTIRDLDGNLYIDLCAGVGVNSTGRCHPRVVEAIKSQSAKLMYPGGIRTTKSIGLARRLSEIMPEGLRGNCLTCFVQSGGAAIETAVKYARAFTKKSQIIAFEGAYHGSWYASMSLTTNTAFREGFGPLMPGVIHMPYAYCYRCFARLTYPKCSLACAKYLDYKLNTLGTGADDVAAIIIEPVQGEGGYVPPPPEFLIKLKQACDRKGILFIADEIQAGAGRTGKMWAIEHTGVVPDMLAWGKGIGGDAPIAGLTMRADLGEKIRLGSQANTFSGNALLCAAAMTNIEILTEDNSFIIKRASIMGEIIKNRLVKAAESSDVIGEVRGKGLMLAIELVKNKKSRLPLEADKVQGLVQRCRERGILVMICGRNYNVMRFMPSLTITEEYVNKGIDTILDVIAQNEAELTK